MLYVVQPGYNTGMTKNLEIAIERLQQMSEERQELLAGLVLHEIEEDQKWSNTTDAHSDKLQNLVDGIIADDEAGKCEPLNPDEL